MGATRIADALATVDAGVAPAAVEPMEARVARSYARSRALTLSLLGLAVSALVVAVVGLYGALAFTVERRRGEMGVRMALGAAPGQVARHVVLGGLALATAGTGVGLAVAAMGARTLRTLLFETPPLDLATFGTAALLLLTTAALAAWLPATRAASEDPVAALRSEDG